MLSAQAVLLRPPPTPEEIKAETVAALQEMFKSFATSLKNELFNLFNNKLNQATENLVRAVISFDDACKAWLLKAEEYLWPVDKQAVSPSPLGMLHDATAQTTTSEVAHALPLAACASTNSTPAAPVAEVAFF